MLLKSWAMAGQRADRLELLRFAQLRLERQAVRLGVPAAADVADERRELVAGVDLQHRDRQLDREGVAVAVLRIDLDQPIQHRAAAGRREARQPAPMRLAKARRDDGLLQRPADRLRRRPAEQRLRARVPAGDEAGGVHLHHRVERVLDDREVAVAALIERGFGLRALLVGTVADVEHVIELARDIADLVRPGRSRTCRGVAARDPHRGLGEAVDRLDDRARDPPGEQQYQHQHACADRRAAQLQRALLGEHVGLQHADGHQPVGLRDRCIRVEAADPVEAFDGARTLATLARAGERLGRCRPPSPLREVARAHRGAACRIERGHDDVSRQRAEDSALQLLEVGRDDHEAAHGAARIDDRVAQRGNPASALRAHEGAADVQPGGPHRLLEPREGGHFGGAWRVLDRGADRPRLEIANRERAEFRLQQDVLSDQRIAALRVERAHLRAGGQMAQRILALLEREIEAAGRFLRHLLDPGARLFADLLALGGEQPRKDRAAGNDEDCDQQKQLPPDRPAAHR